MNKKGQKSLCLVFLLLLNSLMVSVHPFGWQGTGNMSASNMTQIWNFINGNTILTRSDISAPDNFCQQLSTHLNGLWDPAWNVVTIKYNRNQLYDAVLYGYAFRSHWMWYNDYRVGDKIYSFVIWKDYNCNPSNWIQLNVFDKSFNQEQQGLINNAASRFSPAMMNDVWACAKQFIDQLLQKTPFLDSGLSVVMAKASESNNLIYSSICSVTNKHSLVYFSYQMEPIGSYLLFRTR